jgi:hypothetical protein
MKKLMIGLVVVLSLAALVPAQADQLYQEVTMICTTGNVTYSSQLSVAGTLDKIEYIKTGNNTNTFTLATFSAANGTVDTFATKAIGGATSGVIRPRVIGTTTAGVDLAAVSNTGTNAPSATTILGVPYERMRIGGNVKIKLDGTGDDQSGTNVFRVYLVPSDK